MDFIRSQWTVTVNKSLQKSHHPQTKNYGCIISRIYHFFPPCHCSDELNWADLGIPALDGEPAVCVLMDGTVCLHKCVIINKDPCLAGGEPVLHPTVNMKGVHPCAAGLISSLAGNKSPLCFSVCAQHLTRVWITDNCAKFRVAKTVGKVTPWQPLPDSGWRTLKCNVALRKRWNMWKTSIYKLVFMSYSYQPSPSYWTTCRLAGSDPSVEWKLCKLVWVIWVWGFVIKRNIQSNVA